MELIENQVSGFIDTVFSELENFSQEIDTEQLKN